MDVVPILRQCSDGELVECVTVLCQERPLLQSLLHEALTSTLYQPASRAIGVIKKFDHAKRFGFIDCPETFARFGRDVFLSDAQLGNFSIGSEVAFSVTLNSNGHPQAQDLQDANDPLLTRYEGVIKSFMADKNFGFIDCPEAKAQFGRDVFLASAQIGGFSIGSRVSFVLTVNAKGHPQAQELLPVLSIGDSTPEFAAVPPQKRLRLAPDCEAEPPQKRLRVIAPSRAFDDVDDMGGAASDAEGARHTGTINKFWFEMGYGFIGCESLHELFGADVFLSDKQLGNFQVGSTVSFTYQVKNGKPQAYDLQDVMN